jgi:hypothetical protein
MTRQQTRPWKNNNNSVIVFVVVVGSGGDGVGGVDNLDSAGSLTF